MSHRTLSAVAAFTTGCLLMVGSAWAESRVALVIGNSDYQNAGRLANPANDAKAITKALQDANFEVQTLTDLTRLNMGRTLSGFANTVAAKGKDTVAVVFYAGHGLQIEGENYLVPTDANIEREADVPLATMRLADVMKALETLPSKMRVVILDACRNNPFTTLQKTTGRGLAIVDAPAGSLVAYSTSPGQEALDGTGTNSPYTAALVEVMKEPGLQIEQMFKGVRVKVNQATNGRQVPWESSSLTANFAFAPALGGPSIAQQPNPVQATPVNLVSAGAADRPALVASAQPQDFSGASRQRVSEIAKRPADEAYQIVIEENSIEAFDAFLEAFENDARAAQIKRLLARRNQMVAWRNAVVSNDTESYEAYLSLYPDSDNAAAAFRLRERPRFRPIDPILARPIFLPLSSRVKFSNGNGFGNGGGFGNGQGINIINQALNRLGGTRGGNIPGGGFGRPGNGSLPLGNGPNGNNRPGSNGPGFPNGGQNNGAQNNNGQNNGGQKVGNGPLGPQANTGNNNGRPAGNTPSLPVGQNGQNKVNTPNLPVGANQNGQNKVATPNLPAGGQNGANKVGNATTGVSTPGNVSNLNGGINPNANSAVNKVQQVNVQPQVRIQQPQIRVQQQQVRIQQSQPQFRPQVSAPRFTGGAGGAPRVSFGGGGGGGRASFGGGGGGGGGRSGGGGRR